MAEFNFSLDDIAKLGFGNHSFSEGATGKNYAIGTSSNHITNNVYGINHRQTPLPIPMNKDHYGLTFFTRPQLNFQRANLKHSRIMHKLLTTKSMSSHRLIRCTLDPRLHGGGYKGFDNDSHDDGNDNNVTCPLLDPEMAFIPILTNSLNTISGWKDIVSQTFNSKPGVYREEYSMVDGVTVDYSAYDLTASFRNSRGDIITSMFYYWAHYQSLVFEGTLVPYPDFIVENEIDYNTRIYRLTLDPSKTKVQHMAACGAAFPIAAPVGGIFDYSNDKPYNDVNSDIQIPFRAMGFICDDDILIRAFNQTVSAFKKEMYTDRADTPPGSQMKKIPMNLLTLFNNRGYPRIDPSTYELEWYIDTDIYEAKMQALSTFDQMVDNVLGINARDNDEEEQGAKDFDRFIT